MKKRLIIQGIIALKRLDVKISKGNVIPSLNGSQLYSSHPKQKCTKIYPEETAPGPRPLPYMGKILTFDRKVVETPFFYQNDRIRILKSFPSARGHFALKRFLNGLIGRLVKIRKYGPRNF